MKEIAESFAVIKNSSPILFATAINKSQLKRTYGQNAYEPRALAIQSTIHRFAMHVETNQQLVTVVVDEEYKKDKEIRKTIHQLRRYGASKGGDYQPQHDSKLERVLNAVNYSPSEMSAGIQLADVCSGSIWSHFEKQKSHRYEQLKPLFNRVGSRVFEPSVVPSRWKCRKGGMV